VPYVFALLGAMVLVAFTIAGAAATLTAVFFSPFKHLLAFAWRMWLWGSVGFFIANAMLLAFLFPFLSDIGIAGGAPQYPDVLGFIRSGLVLFGPLLFSTAGVILGSWYGWRLARRHTPQPSV
jgi:hypothetical protein